MAAIQDNSKQAVWKLIWGKDLLKLKDILSLTSRIFLKVLIPILLGSVKTHPCDSPVTSSTSFFKMSLYGTDLALPPALATIKTKPQEDNIIAITQCNDDARGFLNLLQII